MKERPQRTRLERALMSRPQTARRLLGPGLRIPLLRTVVLRMVLDHSYAALRRQDLEMTAALLYWPDAVLRFPEDVGPDFASRYEGRDALFDAYRRWLGEWGGMQRDVVGFVDRGDKVVVLAHEHLRGESSGLEVERQLGQVFVLRGAGVAEQWEYQSWDDALAH